MEAQSHNWQYRRRVNPDTVSCLLFVPVLFGIDCAAGNHLPGITGRLGGEVIPVGMDDDGAADDIIHLKPFVVKCGPGVSLAAKQRRQITGMLGMESVFGVVVPAGMGEVIGAVPIFMDVHGVKIRGAGFGDIWQPEYLRLHYNPSVRRIIKFYKTADARICAAATNPGEGLWVIAGNLMYKRLTWGWLLLISLHRESFLLGVAIEYAIVFILE